MKRKKRLPDPEMTTFHVRMRKTTYDALHIAWHEEGHNLCRLPTRQS
jgi:hypothetical protein